MDEHPDGPASVRAVVPRRRSGDRADPDTIFAGGGEMGRRMRAFDWARTALGPVSAWPETLRTCVRVVLTSRQPMFIWWGDSLINLYNDAYKAIVGGKHPEALGRPASVVWREVWDQVGPRAEAAMRGNEGTYDEALLLIMERNGYPEETYYTFSYSPVPSDQGGTGGIICANTDDTPRIIGQRRLALLRELAARGADARTFPEACAAAGRALATNPRDLPFAMVYAVEGEQRTATLAAAAGIERGHAAAPETVALDGGGVWPLAEALRGRVPVVIDDLGANVGLGALPSGAWPRPPGRAVALPVADGGRSGRAAVLVVGLNPFRPLDDDYLSFLDLVSRQVSASLGNALAYESERRRAEALAELDRAKTAFFSNVSHEFRTPLTLMLGPLRDQLDGARGVLPPALREDAELINRNARRLLRLVNSLLDFSRIEAGRAQAVYAPVDLSALTRDLASVFRSAIERGGLRLTIDCPPLPEPVHVDRAMWEKIVLNLLSNAFKFTFEGEIEVSLRASGGAVVLQVKDTGVGIPSEEVPRLFERFHRVEGMRARTHEGSGIGLALVQELVHMHGGSIEADSVLGAGTTFTITLPAGTAHLPPERVSAEPPLSLTPSGAEAYVDEALRWLPEERPAAPPPAPEAAAADPHVGAGPPARILLADDNADMRDYVARLLRARWEVEAVADGAAALAAARARRPDLVLTDVMMPTLDGFGLLRELRADPATRATPVIMLSARAGEEAKVKGLHAGADDYLVKPFSARELIARIETHLLMTRLRVAAEVERARLHALFMSAPAVVAILRGPQHVFELANPACMRIIGDRAAVGRPIREVMPELVEQGFVDILDHTYRMGAVYDASEALVKVDRTGSGRLEDGFFNFVFQPSFGADGRVDGVMVFAFEVTDQVATRRKVEDEHRIAEQAKVEAEAAVRSRDEFLSIASHELRTPLTSLCLQADGALRAVWKDGTQPAATFLGRIEKIRAQARRLEVLVQDLLDVTRLTAGRLQLRVEDVDLPEIARDVCERLRDQAERSGSRIDLAAPASLEGRWDAMRLDQVLTNLVINAIKYGDGKPIEIAVEAPHDGTAVVRVRDQGAGIARENHARIFERFERAVSDTNRGGLGLGLWIARQFVEIMGGTISVGSAPGQGSTFVVELPLAAPRSG
jgi:signal transduction histidine kinase/ActR/RegA family two-component response regulator